MTIRYKCPECESVLKIKDDLAGTDGKCPKCKAKFVVPEPEGDAEPAQPAAGKKPKSARQSKNDDDFGC